MENNHPVLNVSEKFKLLHCIQSISRLPIHVYLSDQTLCYPSKQSLSEDPIEQSNSLFQHLYAQTGIVSDQNNSKIYYFVHDLGIDYMCLIGPMSHGKLSQEELYHYARNCQLEHCMDFHIRICSFKQANNVFQLIYHLFTGLYYMDNSNSLSETDSKKYDDYEKEKYELSQYQWDLSEWDIPRYPYDIQVRSREALKRGDEAGFYQLVSDIADVFTSDYAHTPIKLSEYNAVIMIALMTRILISGGTSTQEAFSLHNQMLIKASTCHSENDFKQLITDAISSF